MPRRLVLALILLVPLAAAADTIELVNGDELSGSVIETSAERVVLDHPVLGRLEIPAEKIKPPKVSKGLFGTSFLAGWKRSFQLGVSGAQGNSKTSDVLAGLAMGYEDEHRRWDFGAAYRFASADGDTTKQDAFAQLRRDWLVTDSPWFFFALGRFDYDEFRTWTYRLSGSPGVGYQFVKSERLELRGLLGPSFTRQFDENDFFIEALVGLEGIWRISKHHSVSLSNFIYPALNDLGEYRNLTSLAWKWKLLDDPGLSLLAGVDNEYQSRVASGFKHDDLKYSTSIGIDF